MAAQHRAALVDDLSRLAEPRAAMALEEGAAAEAGDEAQILALTLVGDREAGLAGERAHGVLGQAAEREAEPVEQRGFELGEHVALVLAGVGRLADERPVLVACDPRVVAGGEAA